jgi:hypothetical protein
VAFSCVSWIADTRRFWYQSCKIQIADTKNTILSQSHPHQSLQPISLIFTLVLDLISIPCPLLGIANRLVVRHFQTSVILIFLFRTQQLHMSSILIFHYGVTSTNYEAIRCLLAFIPHFICSESRHFLEHCVCSDYLSSFKQSMKQINDNIALHY